MPAFNLSCGHFQTANHALIEVASGADSGLRALFQMSDSFAVQHINAIGQGLDLREQARSPLADKFHEGCRVNAGRLR